MFIKLTIKTPITIKVKPIIVYKFGIWLYFTIPTIVVAIIVKPAKEAYVIPIGKIFITLDSEYIHKIIVIALIIVGLSKVNPSALFAKLFEAVPRKTAIIKNIYDEVSFIKV